MTTALLLVLSAAMIAAGVTLIWRDAYRGHRNAFLVRGGRQESAAADPDLEVSVAHREPGLAPARSLADTLALATPSNATDPASQWAALQPVLAAAVEQVNAVLAVAGVSIGAAGEPSKSMSRGYGAYRRILLGGESVAWLRLELDDGAQLQATVKAHKDDFVAINATSKVAAHVLNVARASDLLSECLKPAATIAMRTGGGGSTEQRASMDPIIVAALQATNGALVQAGARFVPMGAPSWIAETRRHRLTVAVEVYNKEIARMLIERGSEEIEIAVGLPDVRLTQLGRRQRIALAGLTTHTLAELIASCTWPAIAHFREAAR
jgi:hypothetical protein